MKKFIKYIIFFLLPVIIIAISVEVLTRQIPNRFKFQANYLNENSNSVETLVLGSSHTLYDVNPEYITSPTFNASNVSQTIDMDFEILKKYENQLSNLKTVVLRLSYTTLFEKLSASSEKWRMKDYTIYYDLQEGYNLKEQSELLSVKFKTNLERIYEFYIQDKNTIETTDLGWGTDASSLDSKDLEKSGAIVAKRHTILDKEFYEENFKTLNTLISYCEEKNIKVVLITFPAYKSYTYKLEKKQLETTINVGKSLEAKFNNCKYYNFIDSNLFEANDFFDADHLNEQGAKKFSLLLNDIIKH